MGPKSYKNRRKPKEQVVSLPMANRRNEIEEEVVESEADDSDEENGDKRNSEDDRVWVQCNNCDKWRSLPSFVDVDSLPDIWSCELNIYDNTRNSCDAPEENYKQTDGQLKSFVRLWVKRLRNGDRAESKLPPAALTRGRKRKLETEWIRCCNPSCGKWRAVLRSIDTQTMLRKLNDNKWDTKNALWFCSMNSWDETTASCAAPQETIYDCSWNLTVPTIET
eukprot:gene18960-24770_t